MQKIIIENRTDKPMEDVLLFIRHVIENGRISNDGKQYCYVTTWTDGTVVVTDLNKKSDRFIVYTDKSLINKEK